MNKKNQKENKKLKNFYNQVYKNGEEKHYTSFITSGTPSDESSEVLKTMSWKNKQVLDVGCGTGLFSYMAAKKGAKVIGIDYSKEAINIAQKSHIHPNLLYQNFDISNFPNKKFDIIVSLGTLEHMDNPFQILKKFKNFLKNNGKIIITSPNWTNPRGYMLMCLYLLFDAPITLADLHYLTPKDFEIWAKKLNMNLKWNTFDKSWAHGKVLIDDFKHRLPNVLSDMKIRSNKKNTSNLIKWIEKNVLPFDNSLPHSGATGMYIFTNKKSKINSK